MKNTFYNFLPYKVSFIKVLYIDDIGVTPIPPDINKNASNQFDYISTVGLPYAAPSSKILILSYFNAN